MQRKPASANPSLTDAANAISTDDMETLKAYGVSVKYALKLRALPESEKRAVVERIALEGFEYRRDE